MLFSRLPPLVIKGGAVALPGKRFNVEYSLYSYAEIIDRLTARFGNRTSSSAVSDWDTLTGVITWPQPDKDRVLNAWRARAEYYDVLGDYVEHHVGPFAIRAYVLGRCWTVYDPEKAVLKSPNGGDPLKLDFTPCLEIGSLLRDGSMGGLSEEGYRVVSELLLGKNLDNLLGLVVTSVSIGDGSVFQVVAQVHFPHAIYGAGEDWVRVRCVAPGGGELVPKSPAS